MRPSVKQIALYSIAALILARSGSGRAQMASQAPLGKAQGPVAISALPSGALVVLGGRGRLSLIDSTRGGVTVLKDSLGYFSPADMAAVPVGDTDSIFVALYNTALHQGLLAKYSLAGAQLQTWYGRTGFSFSGVAIDQIHRTLSTLETP